ncbi:helix-turn-helix domain-containing protein [Geminisphaera colitermitum]|uniref:helix-turn-helix domain-containing protein n=1 Tax=Geminisphaera colitermitum TaxID=1148786 RepID=UPI0001964DF3|nr:helix-turn-helix domain-containing protein [Geminisphaera colitermitum]
MPTDFQVNEEARRIEAVKTILVFTGQGFSQNAAAAQAGLSPAKASRLMSLYQIGGFAALRPRTTNSGRRPLVTLSEVEKAAIQRLTLMSDPHDPQKTRTVGVSFALRTYARSETCRPELADVILKPRTSKHTLTRTLKRLARPTQSSRLLNAGPDTFNLHGICTPRDLTYIDFDGQEKPIHPGLVFEADDMTSNEPCCVEWDDPADPCAARYGVRLVRPQVLFWLDVGTGRYVGYSTILRYNDAYRAKDILWSLSHIFHSVGAPRFLRFEYGTWDAHLINAIQSVHHICQIQRATSAKTKYIENRFNMLQKFLALGGVSMGRHRGVKERETKDWIACRAGSRDPRPLFPTLAQWTARVDAALVAFNAEPVEGEIYGPANARRFHNRRAWIPDEIWHQHMETAPMRKPTLEESYRFLPEQAPVTIRGAHVRIKSAEHDATFYFYSDHFARLGDGYQVTVCCDPSQPHLGAAILNRETGARAAIDPASPVGLARPYREAQLICIAEAVDRVPQFSATSQWDDRASFERRRRYREQCRLQYRAIMPFGRGPQSAATEHRDGRGNVATLAVNAHRLSDPTTSTLDVERSTLDVRREAPRPLSPAIAERARGQDTRALVREAAGRLTPADLTAATEDDDIITEAPPAAFSADEIASLLSQ